MGSLPVWPPRLFTLHHPQLRPYLVQVVPHIEHLLSGQCCSHLGETLQCPLLAVEDGQVEAPVGREEEREEVSAMLAAC